MFFPTPHDAVTRPRLLLALVTAHLLLICHVQITAFLSFFILILTLREFHIRQPGFIEPPSTNTQSSTMASVDSALPPVCHHDADHRQQHGAISDNVACVFGLPEYHL
jgi:hypothetical protein